MISESVKSPLGIIKLLLTVLLTAIVFLTYFGNDGTRLIFGLADFFGVGASVGFCLVVPLIFVTYLWDGNILVFELMMSLIGMLMFSMISVITYNSYSHPVYGAPAGKILALLCGLTAFIFLVNVFFVFCTMRK